LASIEIKTVQNVLIRYELGSFWERVMATIIDWFVIGFSILISYLLISSLNLNYKSLDLIRAFFSISVFFFYSLISEYLFQGSSIGKRAMGLRIMRLDGQPCELLDYVIRWAFRSVDIFISGGAAVGLLVGFTPTRQRIGEILSNTVVVKYFPRENSINQLLKIKSLSNYTPSFLQSGLITEEEAILIKEVLDRSRMDQSTGHTRCLKQMSLYLSQKMGIPTLEIINEKDFLLAVLRDYVALSP